jgi:hypothetical protein
VSPDVERDRPDLDRLGVDVLIVAQPVQKSGNEGFDDERIVVAQVARDVLKAANLRILGQQVEERVEDHEDQPVRAGDRDVGEVADRHGDPVAAGFGPQSRDHRRRQLDAVDVHALGGQRERDAAGADRQFQSPTVAGPARQERDGVVLVAAQRVIVVGGDGLAEAPRGIEVLHVGYL